MGNVVCFVCQDDYILYNNSLIINCLPRFPTAYQEN